MSITPITSSMFQRIQYTAQNSIPVNPTAIGVEEPVGVSLSGEGIYLSELAERAPEGYKMPKIPQSSLKAVEFGINLMQQMKTQRLAGQSTGNNVEDLTVAYDNLQKNLNENSESSQKHSKFLDDAFKDIARFFFTEDAYQQHRNGIDFNEETANHLKQVIADAEKKSIVFSDSFLKNYKKQGLGAYNTAMSLL